MMTQPVCLMCMQRASQTLFSVLFSVAGHVPSPTLSPTDPVPRSLLTVCPGASSGPQGLYTAYIQPICSLYTAYIQPIYSLYTRGEMLKMREPFVRHWCVLMYVSLCMCPSVCVLMCVSLCMCPYVCLHVCVCVCMLCVCV